MNIPNGVGFTLVMSLVSVAAMAGETIGCPPNTRAAVLSLSGAVSSSVECSLLEDTQLRKLVDKFAAGTTFAWPDIPGTCFSGSLAGELTDGTRHLSVSASATSAQRLFPIPAAQGETGVSATSQDALPPYDLPSLQAGAAMTALIMDINGRTAAVLVDDHFLSTELGDDTEDFFIVGAAGDLRLSGRLAGRGYLVPSDDSLTIVFTNVSGNVCVGRK